jgi:alkyldihydroxyacetonephosphate synthase
MRAPGGRMSNAAQAPRMGAAALRRDTVIGGWGEPGSKPELGPETRALLAERIGNVTPRSDAGTADAALPAPVALPEAVIAAAGGPDAVSTATEDRVRHSAGSNYPDLIALRTGSLSVAPDAVVVPADAGAVAAVLAACARERVAVVPFGGGTSVVGGVTPRRGAFECLISLDLAAMRAVELDEVSQVAQLGPGLRGPEAEEALNARGYTLGHFPQSYRYATIGGFAATRSAGQASSGYGRFDALVTEVEMATPTGVIRTLQTPHTAAGPSLRELILGSEGVFGVITRVGVKVRPMPAAREHEGWFAPGFAEGTEIVRALAQGGALPDVVRLSDRSETETSLALSGLTGLRRRALEGYLKLRGRSEGCMLIVGWEGEGESVRRRRELSRSVLRTGGAVPLGSSPGRAWDRGRFDGPHLRDSLLDLGVMVETLETSHTYSRIGELYATVRDALSGVMEAGGGRGLVMCHVSHAYADGASLYFTFLTPARTGAEVEQWLEIKSAACAAIVAVGGTITHHHAVGRDHAPYMPAEIGELGVEVLRTVKDRLDPAGIMNPGKLIEG